MQTIFLYILYFFFYSAAGWLFESTYCSIGEKRIINRGFLTGPMCPIYGTGTLVMEIFLYNPFRDKPIIVLLLGMILCDIVEYFTSYIMEKLFNARWWDYRYELLNLNGRICFKHTLIWGIGSLGFVKYIHPKVETIFAGFSDKSIRIIVFVILGVFFLDLFYAVLKATDMVKLIIKMTELKDAISENADTLKHKIGGKYDRVSVFLSEKIDDISEIIEDGNSKIDSARDDIIISAQIRINQFEQKIRRKKNYSFENSYYTKQLKEYIKQNKNKLKQNPKNLYKQIKSITEEIKNFVEK